MKQSEEDDFRAFVAARMDRWRRAAYLLCHDWHTADDLVSVVVGKLYRHWRRVAATDNPDAYTQRMLTLSWLDETRRPWRREHPVSQPLEASWTPSDRAGDRDQLIGLLAQLAPRQRAVVVLRFYLDHSVEETADMLGISPGTVKSQSARGLETLRTLAYSTGSKA